MTVTALAAAQPGTRALYERPGRHGVRAVPVPCWALVDGAVVPLILDGMELVPPPPVRGC